MKTQETEKLNKYSSYFALKMMQALPDAVVAFEANLQVVFANEAAQMLFRSSEKALIASTMAELTGDANIVLESVQNVVKENKTITLHDVNIGDKYAHRITLCQIESSGLYLMVVNLHSLQLKTEWTNKARQSLKPAEMMARTLAHEIKNPLAGIQAAAQLLAKLKLKPDDRELVDLIAKESDRILRLVQKVDVFGDAAPENFKAVNIHEVLGQVTQVAKTTFGPGVEIEETYDPSLPDLQGDFDRLMQAKLNLVKNAAEALPERTGKILVRTFYDNAAAYHPESRERLPLCIEIEDNGAGISADTLRRIFEPFFTTKPNGEGLGLSIVSKIVDDHGGLIEVKSAPGKTVFRMSFPVKKKAAPKPEGGKHDKP